MTDGNLFPELSSEPQPEIRSDALSPDPDTLSTPVNPEPLPAPMLPPAEAAPTLLPGLINPTVLDGSIPPNLPPEDFLPLTPAPKGKRPSTFWLWAGPALLLILIMMVVGVRAFIVRGIANVSLDVVRPRSGETVFLNQPVTVVARIRSSNGWSKANFYVNNQIIHSIPGQDQNYDQELNFTWTPSTEGATMLRVQVTNLKGNQTATEDVAVMVVTGQSGATITPLPAASATITLTPTKGPSPTPCTDLFDVVSESGLVMGTKLDVGKPFTKSWTLKNVGSCKWEKYKFVFESGSLLGAISPQPVSITEPGGTATLNLNLLSPSIAGNFIGKWRVQNSKGDLFGAELVYGLVIPSPTPTITPTRTDTPTPRPTFTPRPSLTPRFSLTPTYTRTFTPTISTTPTITTTITPTATDTPTFTVTSTPTATYTLTPEPVKYTYSDDFSDINSGWPRGSTNDSTFDYIDGFYVIEIKTASFLEPKVHNDYLVTGDAFIEVDAWEVAGSDAGGFGIVCGFVDIENYFAIGIGTNGSIGVYQIIDGNISTLLYQESQFTPADYYHLIANCQNGRFTLDVNDTVIIFEHPILTADGLVGIYGGAPEVSPSIYYFDNFNAK